jgi:hypothetical protein
MKIYILICILSFSIFTSCNLDFLYSGTPIVVTPSQMLNDYRQNPAECDLKYKDKLVLITGKIDSLFIESPLTIIFPIEPDRKAVIANFQESQRDKFTKLKQGQEVSFLCFGNKSYRDEKGDVYINLLACKIKD